MNGVGEILKRELGRRCAANPRYSLRAFAKALEVSPANLSLILNGKRVASARTVSKMIARLDLTPLDRQKLWPTDVESPVDNLDLSTVERICHWLSYALLSLALTKNFRGDEKWAAKRLGVSVHEVRVSRDALISAGLMDENWRPKRSSLRINNAVTTAMTRQFQRQLIAKALESMENDPMPERDLTSITFAMSPEQMPRVKEEIRKFRLKMAALFEQAKVSEEVYNLTVQIVPVTRRS